MGNGPSQDVKDNTVAAFTLYGFGVSRLCEQAEFFPGAPALIGFCGSGGGSVYFPPPNDDPMKAGLLRELEADLPEAANQAMVHVTWCYHICCTAYDNTASRAAFALNSPNGGWCQKWNEHVQMRNFGWTVHAFSEVYGHGKNASTYLVIRILSADGGGGSVTRQQAPVMPTPTAPTPMRMEGTWPVAASTNHQVPTSPALGSQNADGSVVTKVTTTTVYNSDGSKTVQETVVMTPLAPGGC